jgi:fatty acid desaturase
VVQTGLCALATSGFQLAKLWRYPVFVVLPVVTVFLFLNRLRMFLEHASLERNDSTGVVYGTPITRTIYATWLERVLMCGGNFNYHYEHHLYPVVPGCRLPDLHNELKPELPASVARRSYIGALGEVWSNLSRLR